MAKRLGLAKIQEYSGNLLRVEEELKKNYDQIRILSNPKIRQRVVERSKHQKNRITWDKVWSAKELLISGSIGLSQAAGWGMFYGPIHAMAATGAGTVFALLTTGKNIGYLGGASVNVTKKINVVIPRSAVGKKDKINRLMDKEKKWRVSKAWELANKYKKIKNRLEKKLRNSIYDPDQKNRAKKVIADEAFQLVVSKLYGVEKPEDIVCILNNPNVHTQAAKLKNTESMIRLDQAYSCFLDEVVENPKRSIQRIVKKVAKERGLNPEEREGLLKSAVGKKSALGFQSFDFVADQHFDLDPLSGHLTISAVPGSEVHEISHELFTRHKIGQIKEETKKELDEDMWEGYGTEYPGELDIATRDNVDTYGLTDDWKDEFVARIAQYLYDFAKSSEGDAFRKQMYSLKNAKKEEKGIVTEGGHKRYYGLPIALSVIKKHRNKSNVFMNILNQTKEIMHDPEVDNVSLVHKKYGLKPVRTWLERRDENPTMLVNIIKLRRFGSKVREKGKRLRKRFK